MRIKRKNGLKVAAITIALLLCLALAIGITGAFYQAKRQATGTLSMDQGIIIDYNGFDKTGDEWSKWERTATLPLFSITDAQPGEEITVNAAGIRANEKSVNFYARVKLSYKFYNGETPVELADATKLIKTSSSFWANSWVDGGSSDGYYYYATGTTLNKFEKGAAATTSFVDLFATDAKLVIEGEGFKGATSDGEGGGFKIDETTSIDKIEVYLTLETLQGDATAEQAKALGWKISSEVDFAKVDEGKIVKSNTTEVVTDEQLNVTINGNQTTLETVKFPYDEEVTLKFDTRNVDYITLNYSNGETEKFGLKAEDFANDYLSETALKVTAKSSKGTVKGYTVGLWDSEYKDFIYSKIGYNEDGTTYEIDNELSVSGYFDTKSEITIPKLAKVRNRNFKIEVPFSNREEFVFGLMNSMGSIAYPCQLTYKKNELEVKENLRNLNDLINLFNDINNNYSDEKFLSIYSGPMIFTFTALCETTSVLTKESNISIIGTFAFASNTNLTTINISNNIKKIEGAAFWYCSNLSNISFGSAIVTIQGAAFANTGLTTIIIPDSITSIGAGAFVECSSLTSVTIGNGVKSIGESVFSGCSSLTSVTIGNGVKSIGESVFSGCSSLTSVTIGSGVKSIGEKAFDRCYALAEVYNLSNYITVNLGSSDNGGVGQYAKVVNTTTEVPTRIVKDNENGIAYYVYDEAKIALTLFDKTKTSAIIANDCTEINQYAFEYCSSLTSVAIPNSVTSIGKSAFFNCSGLTSITIPEGITSIGDSAFWGCSGLTSITIPNSVTSIGRSAFINCSSLTSVTIDSATIAGLGSIDSKLLDNATKVYVKSDITTVGSYITGSYTKAASSDKYGYDMYNKNA